MKITSLFTVLLGQRVQTITFLDIDFMKVSFLGLEIVFNKLLKTSRDGHHLPKTILPRWYLDGPTRHYAQCHFLNFTFREHNTLEARKSSC